MTGPRVVTYRWVRQTQNYERYDPQNVPTGVIVNAVYLPKGTRTREFTLTLPEV